MQGGHRAQKGLQHLAGEHTPKIPLDAVVGNRDEDEKQPEQEADYAVEEGLGSLAEAVQDTAQGTGDVHEGADKAEREDKAACQFGVEQQPARRASEQQEQGGAAESQQEAAADGGYDGAFDRARVAAGIRFGDDGQQQDGDGIGDGRGEQDQGQTHSGQHAVNAQSVGVV